MTIHELPDGMRARGALWRALADWYSAGLDHGYAIAYADAEDDMAQRWDEITRPATRKGPDFAELERRRWGEGGREHFGDPRPGDFPGRRASAA